LQKVAALIGLMTVQHGVATVARHLLRVVNNL
jgi:hypothetical protein